ncbi:MAG: stage V sporulation protein AA [Lachnospiraceae bacterium]|nr:stage V sporulation protein AA [Lachnospiraceae bacterium]
MSSETLYLKIDKNIQIKDAHVTLKDIAEVNCSTKSIENKVKSLRLPTESIKGPGRYVYSVLDLIEVIQKEYPNLDINNLGESDFILTVEKEKKFPEVLSWGKTILVCLLAFFGAAFSIMAFNNDVGITTLFGQLYEIFTGQKSNGFTLLEISYSVGVGLGILIFFHHFARKKNLSDPTPLEVEMRTYEDEIDTTMIEANGRNKKKA